MTSLATIIGLLPMAMKLGEGSEAYAPLARALIGGLAVSVYLHGLHRPRLVSTPHTDKAGKRSC